MASAGAAGSSGSAGAPSDTCPEDAPVDPSSVAVHLPIELVSGTSPFVAGADVTTAGGTKYRVGVVEFFLSQAVLITTGGERVAARFADPAGAPRPYDLLLVNSQDSSPPSLDLLARPGSYALLELGIGVPTACNHTDPTRAVFPLNASTGVYWSWATGYMFIRVEGQVEDDGTWAPFLYHVGFDTSYRTVTLATALTVPAPSPAPRLVVDVSRPLESTTAEDQGVHDRPDEDFADRFAEAGTLSLKP